MDKIEPTLKRQLNKDEHVPYPDFENMWSRMEEAGYTSAVVDSTPARVSTRRHKSWRRIAMAASLSALLAAAPVYAAIHYDWGNVLRDKGGLQAVLDQNMGQSLGQTISRDGVTLTLRTAIVDENRTVILYNLDVGKRADTEFWDLKGLSLKDEQGKNSEGEFSYLQWDEKNHRYNGYFESDWSSKQATAKVTLTADILQLYSQQEEDLQLDSSSEQVQSFQIGKDGLQKMEVKAFKQADKILFSSAIIFDQAEAKTWAYPMIAPVVQGKTLHALSGSTYGQPGDHGEYTTQQYFKSSDLPAGQTTYKLQYTKMEKNIDGPWKFDLQLSKKQMESGTIKTALDLPLEAGDYDHIIEKMVVTPTQIRVAVRSKVKGFADIPYQKISLEVNGRTLEGWRERSPKDDPNLLSYKFELPSDLVITKETPITFVGKYKVTVHEDDKTPVLLTDISTKKQTLNREVGGYPVHWTYYMQDGNLYVETGSEDAHFGGINQTHINLGKDRILGRPVTVNFSGDGNNKAIDVYKDFKEKEASLYMFYYTTDEPDKETRVQLQP
ncbi:DUF4179 domain-containing protein [Paenibacillus sp. GCM10012306]|uniref:DUF4179 domain-containing protein n=1 Tax=Paenibacillus sp. GCM10012306 TaxID=3317342 RepID=UPI00361E4E4E